MKYTLKCGYESTKRSIKLRVQRLPPVLQIKHAANGLLFPEVKLRDVDSGQDHARKSMAHLTP